MQFFFFYIGTYLVTKKFTYLKYFQQIWLIELNEASRFAIKKCLGNQLKTAVLMYVYMCYMRARALCCIVFPLRSRFASSVISPRRRKKSIRSVFLYSFSVSNVQLCCFRAWNKIACDVSFLVKENKSRYLLLLQNDSSFVILFFIYFWK